MFRTHINKFLVLIKILISLFSVVKSTDFDFDLSHPVTSSILKNGIYSKDNLNLGNLGKIGKEMGYNPELNTYYFTFQKRDTKDIFLGFLDGNNNL